MRHPRECNREVSIEVIGVSFVPSCPWHGVQQTDVVRPRQAYSLCGPAGGQGSTEEAGACGALMCTAVNMSREWGAGKTDLCHRRPGQHRNVQAKVRSESILGRKRVCADAWKCTSRSRGGKKTWADWSSHK